MYSRREVHLHLNFLNVLAIIFLQNFYFWVLFELRSHLAIILINFSWTSKKLHFGLCLVLEGGRPWYCREYRWGISSKRIFKMTMWFCGYSKEKLFYLQRNTSHCVWDVVLETYLPHSNCSLFSPVIFTVLACLIRADSKTSHVVLLGHPGK